MFRERPIHRKTREVLFAAGGRQIAPTFPLIDADFSVFHLGKVRRSTKGSVQVQVQPTPQSGHRTNPNWNRDVPKTKEAQSAHPHIDTHVNTRT